MSEEYPYPCSRCGLCCLSKPCPHAVLHYGLAPTWLFGGDRTEACPGLSFNQDGVAQCALVGEDPTEETREAFGVGKGCCFKGGLVVRGKEIDFASLPAWMKRDFVARILKNPEMLMARKEYKG